MRLATRLTTLAFSAFAATAAWAETAIVTIDPSSNFAPARLQITAGDTVLFKNESRGNHTVTADRSKARNPDESVLLPEGAEPFDSGRMRPGDTFEHVFTVPGTYRYFCQPHESNMIGEIEVLEAK